MTAFVALGPYSTETWHLPKPKRRPLKWHDAAFDGCEVARDLLNEWRRDDATTEREWT